ncbi:nucleotidyltransferase family protein [Alphaproteobacteria bacterium]|nr:nucleotidyltransferase family protein [Alphaproteobacteria bacterium]
MKKYNNIFIKKILLAAGNSKRYGNKNKLTEKFKGKHLVQHIRDTLLKVFDPCELLVILGHDYKIIRDLIDNKDIRIINNKKYKNGIGTSISLGIQDLDINIEGVMIIPADMPFITTDDLIKLENKFVAHNCEKVVLPKYKYKIGNPVILPKSYFATLKNLKEDFGARSQIKENDMVKVDCGIGTVFDIDTSKALAKANVLVRF